MQRKTRQLPEKHEEIVATAMMLGEEKPILCSSCIGSGKGDGVFGGWRRCGQCGGTGYDWIGPRTIKSIAHMFEETRK